MSEKIKHFVSKTTYLMLEMIRGYKVEVLYPIDHALPDKFHREV